MDLFNSERSHNKLPYDGEVYYYDPLLSAKDAQLYYQKLFDEVAWENDTAFMFGKLLVMDRKVALYADEEITYTYAKIKRQALPWTEQLMYLKKLVEEKTGEQFNSCLLNLYHSGSEGMGWHTDAEKELKENGAIASLSFGAERKFVFKHKESKNRVSILLEKSSLLIMQGTTQKHWLHSLPKTTKVSTPRINLTFRTINL